ncbi:MULTISPECIES: DUF1799 domain-containing protein [Salinicola]|uniref:DUF1799 domain-containing protein n=1 Tax=Salinicola endophyticus TaxID=1949083 RepID=A0AB74UG09_9GAMM|nr:DUF1799 domain-containing protein [Salinicola sp. JS01]WIX33293.1 DUF1799 domain-containing protein [Salinicola sp. JS01]
MPETLSLDDTPETFAVLPENWEALALFLDCATQWKQTPMGGVSGLDYAALKVVMELSGVTPGQAQARFQQVRRLERGALEAMRET